MHLPSLNGTRIAAALSLVALILVTYSDLTWTGFWDRNAMATSIVADVLVLIVGVAVVNEYLAARSRRSWQLLTDYALIELAETASEVWATIAEAIGVGDRSDLSREQLRERLREAIADDRTAELARSAAAEPGHRRALHQVVEPLADTARDTLSRWAALVAGTPHAQAITAYVRMQAELAALALALGDEAAGRRPTYAGTGDPVWIAARIAAVLDTGSAVDRELSRLTELRQALADDVPSPP